MEKVSIKIDDLDVITGKEKTILETALANNIFIPHLCYHPDLKTAGSCRLCLVELDDGKILTSCRTAVREGMIIKTKSDSVNKIRKPIVEMMIANHHMDCKNCLKKGNCQLQKIMSFMKIDKKRIGEKLRIPQEDFPIDDSNPFFIKDHNKCVLCGICVRTCQEIQRVNAIDFAGRGNKTRITTFGDRPMAQSNCVSCGECVIRCPVGALNIKNFKKPSFESKTICPHCSVGCGIFMGIRDNNLVNVRGDKDNISNNGLLCARGRFGLNFIRSANRLTTPLKKNEENKFIETSWEEALDIITENFRKYKGDEFALISSAKCTNEDNYIAQKFARVVMGSNNIDTVARLCDTSSLYAFYLSNTMKQLASPVSGMEKAKCILIAGSNITSSHPVLGLKLKRFLENSGTKLIVISPKETEISRIADIWLRPYPGTDLALLMGMCKIIVDSDLFDLQFIEKNCIGFEDFKESLEDFPPGRVERITGVSREAVEEAAKMYTMNKPGSILWSSGITQSVKGTDNVLSIINLSLLAGNAVHSFGLVPLWGQNNAFGAFNAGCLHDFYPSFQPLSSQESRERFESLWGKKLNPAPGLALTEIIDALNEGKIKALYIIGADLVSDIPPSNKVRDALEKAAFVVVQDIFFSNTARYANIVLPAQSFAEKDGTFTNIERRSQRINKVMEPVGYSLSDWKILCQLGRKSGSNGFNFESTEEILLEMANIISKIGYSEQRFKFSSVQYKPPAETPDIDYPLLLTVERNIYSGGFLPKEAEGFNILRNKEFVYINPKDAADFEIKDGDNVKIFSHWGVLNAEAKVTKTTPSGLITMNLFEEKVNHLFNPALDPVSKTPEMKLCAARIEPYTGAGHE